MIDNTNNPPNSLKLYIIPAKLLGVAGWEKGFSRRERNIGLLRGIPYTLREAFIVLIRGERHGGVA